MHLAEHAPVRVPMSDQQAGRHRCWCHRGHLLGAGHQQPAPARGRCWLTAPANTTAGIAVGEATYQTRGDRWVVLGSGDLQHVADAAAVGHLVDANTG